MAHILQHPEMIGMEAEIAHVLQRPAEVRLSPSDSTVQLFYEYYAKTRVGGMVLCRGKVGDRRWFCCDGLSH